MAYVEGFILYGNLKGGGRAGGNDLAGEACRSQSISSPFHGILFQLSNLLQSGSCGAAINLAGMGGNAAEFQIFQGGKRFHEIHNCICGHPEAVEIHIHNDGIGNDDTCFFRFAV